jgi:hypothetical protein
MRQLIFPSFADHREHTKEDPTMLRKLLALILRTPVRQVATRRNARNARPWVEPLEGRDLPACLVPANTCFAVIGDYGQAGQYEEDVADLVKSWNPDFIITTGDNNYESGAASTIDRNIGQYYHDYIYPYSGSYGSGASTNKFFPSLGNHDWQTTGARPYLDYFALPDNERYYDFTRGSVEFFAIDSDSHEPDGTSSTSVQANWLRNELAASTATWKIVYMHHPPYSSGSNHGSETRMQWPYQSWGASAVLAGHDHLYERIVRSGFPYFVNGLGGNDDRYGFGTPVSGSQVRYNSNWGAMLVDASDSEITFQFITRSGSVVDTYTLTKSGSLPTVTIAAADSSASEPGTNTGKFTVTRTGSTSSSLSVNYTTAGTATAGSDYNALSGSVTIPSGSATANITVTPKDDSSVEGTETVIVTLASSSSYNRGTPSNATVNIADNDTASLPTVTITASDSSASEPGSNTGKLTVTRTGSTSSSLTVNYTTGGTATAGSDYNTLSGSVTIPSGSASANITVTPKDDSSVEGTETVIVTLSSSSSYNRGTPNNATVNIADNDTASLPTVTISASDSSASEPGSNTGKFKVTRTGSTSSSLTVKYTVSGTATAGSDYNSLSGTVTIPSGSASASITVTPKDDSSVESTETVIATLASSSSYNRGTPNSAAVSIADNDVNLPIVTISAIDPAASEPISGRIPTPADPGRFQVTRTGSTESSLTVKYTIAGTAKNGTDYKSLSGSVTIHAGSASAFITINPNDDALDESIETVILTLASNSSYSRGSPNSATVRIADGD